MRDRKQHSFFFSDRMNTSIKINSANQYELECSVLFQHKGKDSPHITFIFQKFIFWFKLKVCLSVANRVKADLQGDS